MSNIRNGLTLLLLAVSSFTSAQDPNIALHKYSKSSAIEGDFIGFVSAGAFDGKGGNGQVNASGNCNGDCTRWSSAFSDPQWVYVDLGGIYRISSIDLYWEVASGKDFKIQVSPDSTNWTDLVTVTNNNSFHNTYTFSSNPLPSARCVRMYGTARNTGYGYSLWEMEVHGPNIILPIRLSNFSALVAKNKVELSWKASTEAAATFSVEYSTNGINFSPIGTVASTTGNGTMLYHFTDTALVNGKKYYRIILKENGTGNTTYSPIVSVDTRATATLSVYPNPIKGGVLYIGLPQAYNGIAEVVLRNAAGITVSTQTVQVTNAAQFSTQINSTLLPGIYWLDIVQKEQVLHKQLFVQ